MQTFWDNVLRVVAVIGLIAVLLLGAWGIIQLAFMLPSFFHNLGSSAGTPARESVTVSVPAAVVGDRAFTLTWRHTGGTGEVAYSVAYSCATGLSIAAPTPAGTYATVACNTPFNYTDASTSMPLVATLKDGQKSAQTTFTVSSVSLASKQTTASGQASTNVSSGASTAKPSTTASKPSTGGSTYYPSGRTANLYGYPDLAVSILSAQSQGGNATVTFAVSNVGTNVTPSNWTLNAQLPSGYTYPAGAQQALYPGDRIVYTLRYSEDTGSGNSYNPCTGWSFPCQPGVTYGGPTSCNQFGPCAVPGYSSYNYVYNQYTYGSSGNIYNYYGNTRTVSVMVDPYNQIVEATKYNNNASQTYLAY